MSIAVRPANARDIPWMLEELVQLDQFFGAERPLMPSVDFARERLSWMIQDPHRFLSLVVVNKELDVEQQLGFLVSIFMDHFFTPEIIQCQSLLWWTTLKARGTIAGTLLLDTWVRQASARANWIVLTIQEKTPINLKALNRRGFKQIDVKYLLEIPSNLPGVPL